MVGRIFFIICVVLIFWGLNYSFIWHLSKFFSFKIDRNLILISIGLTLILPIAMIFHSVFPNIITRGFYIISVTWLGIIFFSFFFSLITDVAFHFIKIPLHIKAYIWLSLIIGISSYALFNQSGLPVVKEITMTSPKVKREIKIGYLSDVHIDGIHNIGYLDKIIDKLNTLDIDLVLINGDLVDGTSFEKHSFKNLDRLKTPVYITFGNHESYIGRKFAMSLFENTKAKVLNNEVIEYKGLQILGIEDLMGMQHTINEQFLEKILDYLKWDKDKPSLMLLHEPIGSELADSRSIDFQLGGHTHNGQIWPFNYLVGIVFPHVLGQYKIGNLQLYVGPGTGVWGPPMRLGSQNEITLITIKK